jgi:starvation-inducible DNA-binding protein
MNASPRATSTAPRGSGARVTRPQNAESGFTASEKSTDLQKVVVDLLELQMQGKQAHGNVVGKNFRDTHRVRDEIIHAARAFSDEVAERLRAPHAVPDGRSDTVAATTTLQECPTASLEQFAWMVSAENRTPAKAPAKK